MNREERLKALFDELERDAYNAEYHNYYYKEANQIIRKHFELSLPPVEGAEEILKNRLGNQYSILSPLGIETIIAAMRDFATLHAHRIAEKMVDAKTSRNGC